MRQRASVAGALVFLALVLMPTWAGCASPARPRARLATCLPDPASAGLWCDGKFVPWADSGGLACVQLDDLEALLSCR
jgi:hypothetical protein